MRDRAHGLDQVAKHDILRCLRRCRGKRVETDADKPRRGWLGLQEAQVLGDLAEARIARWEVARNDQRLSCIRRLWLQAQRELEAGFSRAASNAGPL